MYEQPSNVSIFNYAEVFYFTVQNRLRSSRSHIPPIPQKFP